jgi:hypothetical protein
MRSGREDIDRKLQVNFHSFSPVFRFLSTVIAESAVICALFCLAILLVLVSYSSWFSIQFIGDANFTSLVLLH